MRALKYFIAVSIATTLAFTNCTKEIETSDKPEQEGESSEKLGAPVVFGVSTSHSNEPDTKAGLSEEIFTSVDGKLEKIGEMSVGYSNGPETKAQYSGEIFPDVTGAKFERIDWEIGDTLRIHYPRNSHNGVKYKIYSQPSNNGRTSKANVKSLEGTGLQWLEGTGPHRFFGVYPETKKSGSNRISEFSYTDSYRGIRLKANIPHRKFISVKELMSHDVPIMAGGCIVETHENEPVNLPLSPQVNTFDIELRNELTERVKVSGIKLSSYSSFLGGSYYIDLAPKETGKIETKYTIIKDKDLSSSVELAHNDALIIEPGQKYKARLYTIPQTITHMVLEIYYGPMNGLHWYGMDLKYKNGRWVTVAPGGKTNLSIKLPKPEFTSPKYNLISNFTEKDTLFYPPFKLLYPKMPKKPIGKPLKVVSYKEMGQPVPTKYPVPWSYWYNVRENLFDHDNAFEGEHKEVYNGSTVDNVNEGEAFKLCMADIDNRDGKQDYYENVIRKQLRERTPVYDKDLSIMENGKRSTANCYRVTSKGKYMFPLIYGNCIKDGKLNRKAFTHYNASDFYDGLGRKIDADNYQINSPITIELVWEESKGMIEKLSIFKRNNEYYAEFTLGDKIDYGSALIAARSGGKIVWSWHIWVVPDIDDKNVSSGSISKRPLGYAPDRGGCLVKDYKIGIEQFEYTGKTLYNVNVRSVRGYSSSTCLYYTYGRTAPSIPSLGQYYKQKYENGTTGGNVTTMRQCYKASFSLPGGGRDLLTEKTFTPAAEKTIGIATAVSSPEKMGAIYKPYVNLWDNGHYPRRRYPFLKTVYDPCPVGYHVPTTAALDDTDFTNYQKYGIINNFDSNFIDTEISIVNFEEKLYALGAGYLLKYPKNNTPFADKYAPIFPMKE